MLRKILLLILCCSSVTALIVAPSSAEFDIVANQTYQLELFSPSALDSVDHTCPFDAQIDDNTLYFELNEFANNGSQTCQINVFDSNNPQVKASLDIVLSIQKEEIYSYTYELFHYTPFVGSAKGELHLTNEGNIVLYPTLIAGNESVSKILLPGEKQIIWLNLSETHVLICERECDVLIPTEYVVLDKPTITMELSRVGRGVQVKVQGIDFPVDLVLHSDSHNIVRSLSENGLYYFEEDIISATIVYESVVLAFDKLPIEEKRVLFSTKFIVFVVVIIVLFLLLFFLQRKKHSDTFI